MFKKYPTAWANSDSRRQFRHWYSTYLGKVVNTFECSQLDSILSNLFGYHLLQVGVLVEENLQNLLSASRISHHMVIEDEVLDCISDPGLRSNFIQGSAESLPIATDSLDVLVLPHVLEFSPDPHQVLREADRILIPEGHVVMLGFNPWSVWTLWRLLFAWRRRPPWNAHFISTTRVKDWFSLLGFDIMLCRKFFFRPPVNNRRILDRLSFLETVGSHIWPASGGIYVIVAKKRLLTLSPIKPRWRPKRSILATGAIETQNREQGE